MRVVTREPSTPSVIVSPCGRLPEAEGRVRRDVGAASRALRCAEATEAATAAGRTGPALAEHAEQVLEVGLAGPAGGRVADVARAGACALALAEEAAEEVLEPGATAAPPGRRR